MNITRPLAALSCGVYITADGVHEWVFRDNPWIGNLKLAVGLAIVAIANEFEPMTLYDRGYSFGPILAAPALLSIGIAQLIDGANARQNGQSWKRSFCTGTVAIALAVYCFYKGYGNLSAAAQIAEVYERSPGPKACIDMLNDGFGFLPPNVLNGSIGQVYNGSGICTIRTSEINNNLEWYHFYEPNETMRITVGSSKYFRIYYEYSNCNSTILGKATEVCKRVWAEGFGGIQPVNLFLFKNISTIINESSVAKCSIFLIKEAAKLLNPILPKTNWEHGFNIKLADDCLLVGDLYPWNVEGES